MNPVQYIIADARLGMSPGKLSAQVAHASVQGLLTHVDFDTTRSPYNYSIVNRWQRGGHYAKVVLEAGEDLHTVERYLNDRGFKTALIIDEGLTEFGGGLTPTAIGTGIVDKDSGHVRDTFGGFKLYGTKERSELMDRIEALNARIEAMSPKTPWWRRNLSNSVPDGEDVPDLRFSDYGYP